MEEIPSGWKELFQNDNKFAFIRLKYPIVVYGVKTKEDLWDVFIVTPQGKILKIIAKDVEDKDEALNTAIEYMESHTRVQNIPQKSVPSWMSSPFSRRIVNSPVGRNIMLYIFRGWS